MWPPRAGAALLLALQGAVANAQPCPVDLAPRAAGTLLTVQVGDAAPRAYDAAALAALPTVTLEQRRQVAPAGAASGAAAREQRQAWGGTLLRDVLADAGFGRPGGPRSERTAVVEAVATDGWRGVFSWGELFNHPDGAQVIVITRQDGQPLDTYAGPLALRALADLRPGPRHVRNLCALRVRGLG